MDWKDIGEQQTDSQIASVFWLVFGQRYVMDCSYMEGKFRIDLGIGKMVTLLSLMYRDPQTPVLKIGILLKHLSTV